jgi:Zn-dependent M28 family amino/carboxypeptidase
MKSWERVRILAAASCLAALLALLPATRLPAQSSSSASIYADAAERLRRLGLQDERAYDLLRDLTALGPRLTGSPQAAAAVALTAQMMQDLDLDDVHYETVTVSRWVRGEAESASIVGSALVGDRPMAVCALGGSVSSSEVGVTAPVVEVKSLQDLAKLGAQVKGKIVFFNRAMDRSQGDVFAAYGVAAEQRVRGAADAAKLGAVAVLIRSLTLRIDDHPHTGAVEYEPQAPKIPAAAISTRDAEFLSALLRRDQNIRVRLQLNCRTLGPVASVNVVGQITGTAMPNEIVLVGGHLDSWDLSPGAHDDGAGCVIALEALRLI